MSSSAEAHPMTLASPAVAAMSAAQRWTAIIVCWLLIVFDGYDLIVFGTVKASLLQEWEMSQAAAGTLGSMAFLGMMIGAVVAGRLSDSLGRKTTVMWCTIIFSVATVACAVATSPVMFGGLRLIAGLGLGGLVPSANALASELVPTRWRSAIATLMMSGVPLGGSLAAITGIPVIPADWLGWDGWRWMFVFPILALIVLLPALLRLVPNSLNAVQKEDGSAGSGFGALLRPPYLLMSVLFALATLATLLAWYGLGTELPNLMRLQGAQLGGALTFALVLNLGAVLGSVVTAWAAVRVGPMLIAAIASALAAIGLIGIMTLGTSPVWLIYVLLVMAGVGTHGTQALVIGAITLYYPGELRGTALGWALGVGRIGAVLAPQLAGIILGSFAVPADGVSSVFLLFAGAAAAATVLLFLLMPIVRKVGVHGRMEIGH